MEGKWVITKQLHQLTPLLHFRAEEEGACLRATAVKPRLDGYVLGWLKKQGLDADELPEGWTAKDDAGRCSLRYKMRFRPLGRTEKTYDAHPLYFAANMQKNDGENGAVASVSYKGAQKDEDVEMKLIVLTGSRLEHPLPLPDGGKADTLAGILEGLLPFFFTFYCFGIRSNKGFGSFEVKMKESLPLDEDTLEKALPAECDAVFVMKNDREYSSPDERLGDIYVLSALMKGGVNYHNVYCKGAVQTVLADRGIGSEKAFIKQKVFTNEDRNKYRGSCASGRTDPLGAGHKDYRFIRAMLGMADHYFYRGVCNVSVSAADSRIQRFGAPVRFHPLRSGLLILAWRIPDVMYGAEFEFYNKGGKRRISTPSKEEFDLVSFLEDFLEPFSFPVAAGRVSKWDEKRGDGSWEKLIGLKLPRPRKRGGADRYGTQNGGTGRYGTQSGGGNGRYGPQNGGGNGRYGSQNGQYIEFERTLKKLKHTGTIKAAGK